VIVYLNGAFVPAEQATVSVFDGGYMYGDGIYTTMRLYKGLPLDLKAHWQRLKRQTEQLKLTFDLTFADLQRIIAELVAHNNLTHTDGRLRITISRSGSPALPMPLDNLLEVPTTITMTLTPVAMELAQWQADGIAVICLGEAFARGNFPELKTLNALATLSALRQAAAAGCPEALLTGPDGRLLEGAISNIFLVSGDHLVTPASEGGFLPGRTRERILKIAARENIEVRQKVFDQRHLSAACEVFVVSSVREVLPVVKIDDYLVGDGKPGPTTRLFQDRYQALIVRDLQDQK